MREQISGQIGMSDFPTKPDKLPPVGTIMYFATEHYYYNGNPWPETEYLVCKARVRRHCQYGSEPEIDLIECRPHPHGICYDWDTPRIARLSEIGKNIFYTPKEAAKQARDWTDRHERTWSWIDTPLRRTWERLLDGVEFYLAPLISKRYPNGGGDFERGGENGEI